MTVDDATADIDAIELEILQDHLFHRRVSSRPFGSLWEPSSKNVGEKSRPLVSLAVGSTGGIRQ
jgi:hypothetical protein